MFLLCLLLLSLAATPCSRAAAGQGTTFPEGSVRSWHRTLDSTTNESALIVTSYGVSAMAPKAVWTLAGSRTASHQIARMTLFFVFRLPLQHRSPTPTANARFFQFDEPKKVGRLFISL